MALLEVKGLTKTFGGLVAVNEIDFSIDDGQIISVIGPNGAGKTTFFNMISGYYPLERGTISFEGKPLKNPNPETIATMGIARTFQNIRLFSNMLTIENILLGMHQHIRYGFADILLKTDKMRKQEKESFDKAMSLLSYVGLTGKEEELAKNLSYGDQRRLEIARALALRPKLLLLDEPAAGLNPRETEEMKHFIVKIRDEFGCAVLLIEHDMKLVMGLSERIAVINYGVKIAEGTPEEIRNNKEVIRAYLGDDVEVQA